MKKSMGFLTMAFFFIGCNSDNDMKYKDTDKKEVKTENPVGIQNVNGNIPDTTNTIDIGNSKKDTTIKAEDSPK